jgi:hypothetical protein
MKKETKEESFRLYLRVLPDPKKIPPGFVLTHGAPHRYDSSWKPVGRNVNFKAWLEEPSEEIEICDCEWAKKIGFDSHYQVKPPPPPPPSPADLEYERRKAAEKAEAERVAAMTREERIQYWGEKEEQRRQKAEQEKEAFRQKMEAQAEAERRARHERKAEEERVDKMTTKIVNTGYKTLATKLHPDHGGSHDDMRQLNAARTRLKRNI